MVPMKKCVYCHRSNVKFSREHVISKSALTEAFSPDIRNIVHFQDKKFIDHEQTIKHVHGIYMML